MRQETNMEWNKGQKLSSRNHLKSLEDRWKVVLPDNFKNIIVEKNRSRPELDIFDTKRGRRVFGEFLDFDLNNKNNVLEHYEWIKDKLPSEIFPFAIDPGGNYLCFDYRKDVENPQIVFWDHEGFVVDEKEVYLVDFVAFSFSDLVNKLYKVVSQKKPSDFKGFERLD